MDQRGDVRIESSQKSINGDIFCKPLDLQQDDEGD